MAEMYGGRWRTIRSLGQGGQARTFLVQDTTGELPGSYVLKRLLDHGRLPRFAREVEILRSLDHPHVLRIVDHQLDQVPAYLVSEYCEGGDLDHNRQPWVSDREKALALFC